MVRKLKYLPLPICRQRQDAGNSRLDGFGELALGPITGITLIENALSSGQKIYVSQVDYLASQTGDQVSRYLSQYAATEHWISPDKAKYVHIVG
jgi:hypothetical protein